LEVENKSATPYSSKRDLQRPGKVEDFFSSPPSFLHSAALDLNENQGRIDKTTKKGDDNSGQK
jgi:hypothetical protein